MNNDTTFSKSIPLLIQDESHLKNAVEKYPWCSVAQFYLLHYYKKTDSTNIEKQETKTALFFNKQNWLNWQLHLLSEENKIEAQILYVKEEVALPANNEQHQVEIIEAPITKSTSETNTAEDLIAFEPLHTVDYFASQGIKITEEPVTNDKLGSQMKSFTEWLKSMKKIHKENLPAGDEQTDKNIQTIAEHSNEDAAIVTEAMADVLIKQGKTEKARELYEKLSLQNPAKSAYFAAKINSLSTGN